MARTTDGARKLAVGRKEEAEPPCRACRLWCSVCAVAAVAGSLVGCSPPACAPLLSELVIFLGGVAGETGNTALSMEHPVEKLVAVGQQLSRPLARQLPVLQEAHRGPPDGALVRENTGTGNKGQVCVRDHFVG
mmetsp:Transcript_16524/g.29347  ORF Transcript_16524/g.29347 Transcript_16524/m.29347 type:complete len:134 (-) Transcript_16524:1913-2314(-)